MADLDITGVEENISGTEDVLLTFDLILNYNVAPFNLVRDFITVFEFAQIGKGLHLTGELADNISLSEFAQANFNLNIDDASDSITIDDSSFQAGQATVGLALSVFDEIITAENLIIGRDPLLSNVFDNISVIEFPVLGFEIASLPTSFEIISISEVVLITTELDLSFNQFLRGYPFIEDTITNVLVMQFENGAEQRRDKWGRTRKRFTIQFGPRTKTEIDPFKTFYEQKTGQLITFNFLNPLDNIVYTVRFEEASLIVQRIAFDIYQSQVALVEVF